MAPEGEWDGTDVGDGASVVAMIAVFTGLFVTETVLTTSSAVQTVWGITLFAVALPNNTPPIPFHTAGNAWQEYNTDLTQLRDELGQLIMSAAGREGSWTGDSADQLNNYAEGKLINGMDGLIELSETVGNDLKAIGESATADFIFNVALAVALIIFQTSAWATKAIPVVGEGIFQTLMTAGYIALITATVIFIAQLIGSMMSFSTNQQQWGQALRELEQTFGAESNDLDQAASQIRSGDIKSIID